MNEYEEIYSMQRFPAGGSSNLQLSTILKILGILVIFSLITYFINIQFGSYYAWIFVFFIVLNAYFGWRAYRRTIADYKKQASHRPQPVAEYVIEENTNPQDQQDRWKDIENQYEKCESCDAEVIPGLGYCEECGASL